MDKFAQLNKAWYYTGFIKRHTSNRNNLLFAIKKIDKIPFDPEIIELTQVHQQVKDLTEHKDKNIATQAIKLFYKLQRILDQQDLFGYNETFLQSNSESDSLSNSSENSSDSDNVLSDNLEKDLVSISDCETLINYKMKVDKSSQTDIIGTNGVRIKKVKVVKYIVKPLTTFQKYHNQRKLVNQKKLRQIRNIRKAIQEKRRNIKKK